MSEIKHGIYLWIKHGQLPSLRGKRKVSKALEDIEKRLVSELGGWNNITPQQELLLRTMVKSYGILLLTELFVNKYGPLNPVQAKQGILEYQPLFKAWQSFQNCVRLNLEKLFPEGLGRKKAEEILAPYEIIEREKKAEEKKASG